MFQLHDLRESKVWQEAQQVGKTLGREEGREEGRQEGREEGREERDREFVKLLQDMGKPLKEIAELMKVSLAEVRRYARSK